MNSDHICSCGKMGGVNDNESDNTPMNDGIAVVVNSDGTLSLLWCKE